MRTLVLLLMIAACNTPEKEADTGTPVTETDADGDGYTSEDCDDGDAAIHPGADEICDGIDNDCDGSVDDSALDAPTWYADADGDGYGDPSLSTVACAAPTGMVANGDDCDDGDAAVQPDADEICDGLDNDCDGTIDEPDAIDAPIAWGGTDCDDSDPGRYGGTNCRPAAPCTHPDVSTLTAYDPVNASDFAFTSTCTVLIGTILPGVDMVRVLDTSPTTMTTATWRPRPQRSRSFPGTAPQRRSSPQ